MLRTTFDRDQIRGFCKRPATVAVSLAALSIIVHLLPFLAFGPHPLGYDTGFYRRYLIKPIASFPNGPVPGLGDDALIPRAVLDFLRVTGLPTDVILYGSYLAVLAASAMLLFLLMRRQWGSSAAALAGLIFVLAPIQYVAFWFMLWKNAFATLLLFATFLLLERRSAWVIVPATAIAASHETSTVILLLTLGVYAVINPQRWRTAALAFVPSAAAFLFLHRDLGTQIARPPVAVFLGSSDFLMLVLPLLPFALVGLWQAVRRHPESPLLALAITAGSFTAFQLPFHERVSIFLDIAVATFAAIGIVALARSSVATRHVRLRTALLFAVVVAFSWNAGDLVRVVQTHRPLIAPLLLAEISSIESATPSDAAILTSTDLAPWAHGWNRRRVIAPGMLGDHHNLEAWTAQWQETDAAVKTAFFTKYPQPLYFFIAPAERDAFLSKAPCIIRLSEYLSEFRCARQSGSPASG